MPELRLQDYVTKIKDLIQSNRVDEAIAHCQHILSHHTKHLEIYCLLGEACLEKGAWREAIEFFQRTLSADPENFIARVGLGAIYSEQGALSSAIWQMERAFELAPGNAEVRRQLQHLYDQRDGGEKARLRLTQGALGRLYSRNGLYERAIGEFRAILDQDPDLPDIQIALAEALWLEGRRLEAVDACLDLVDALPHCLKANLILGEVWTRGGHGEAGEERLEVAQSLDPENRLAQEMMGEESPLPPREVLIPELDVIPGALVPVVAETSVDAELAWLEGEEQAEEEQAVGEISDWLHEGFTIPEKDLVPEGEAMQPSPEEAPPAQEETPVWLQQLVGEMPTSPAGEEEVLPEEPERMETVVPPVDEPAVGDESGEVAVAEFPEEKVPGWMPDLDIPSDIDEESELVLPGEDVPDSLRALVEAGILDESDVATAMAEMTEEDLAAQQDEEVPDWLRDLIGEDVVAQTPVTETAIETREEEVSVPPIEESTLVAEDAPEGAVAEEEDVEDAVAEDVPEWAKDLLVPAAEPAAEPAPWAEEEHAVTEEMVTEGEDADEVPEWAKDLVVPPSEPAVWDVDADAVAEEEVLPGEDVEDLPEWLKELDVPVTEPSEAPAEEVVSPLKGAEVPAVEEPSRTPSAALEEEPLESPQDGVPDSLWALVEAGILDESDVALAMAEMSAEDLAAQQAEEVPDWLRDLVGEEDLGPETIAAPAPEEEVVSPPYAEEVPDWLREAGVVPEEEVSALRYEVSPEEEPPVPAVDEIEVSIEAAAPTEVEPEVEEPVMEETFLEPPAAAREFEETLVADEEIPAPKAGKEAEEVAPEPEAGEEEDLFEEVLALEEMVVEPPLAEVVEEPQVPVMEAEEESLEAEEEVEVLEEAAALEEMVVEPPLAEVVEAPQIPDVEVEEKVEAPEVDAGPPTEMAMVAPYDRVEVEEDVPAHRRIDDLEQRLKANPRDFPLRLELARLYREERDWDAALKHYQKLISARMFLPAILDDLELMLKREVEPVHIYQLMGDAYMQDNALDKALEMYRLAQQALTKR